jgi:hypothetical protein
MAYSIEQADLLAAQLEKFTTSYAHHLVGQFANVDFWLDEAKRALEVIENYNKRFTRMRDAQKAWIEAHKTVVSSFCPVCRGKCEFDPRRPEPPTRIRSQELEAAKRRLKDAVYKFLLRCHRAGLTDEAGLKAGCQRVGTSVDLKDLRRA